MDVIFRKDGSTAHVTINRESSLNALNSDVFAALDDIFQALERDRDVLTVVLSGAGPKAFVAGADILEVQAAGEGRPALIEEGKRTLAKIGSAGKVVIAAINGYALGGGCELALFCDLRVASERAKFGFPEAKLGLMPGYGGTQLLPRLVGPGAAKRLLFTGETIDALEALRIGLVDKVCSAEALLDEATGLAARIAASGPVALQCIKRAVDEGLGLSLPEALGVESREYREVARSKDAERGIAAFLEKRKPAFRGD